MDFAGDALYRLVRFDDTYGFRLAIRLRVKRRVGLDGPGSVSATLERACTLENVRSRWGWWPIRQSRRDYEGEAQACNCRLLHAANPVMNVTRAIVNPYIGICKHPPIYSNICRHIQAQCADRAPGEFRGGEPCTGRGYDG